jgi:hypothetical protein
MIFQQFENVEWVMDLASGKGQDLFRYGNYGFNHVLFAEIDKNALFELINRKHIFSNDRKTQGRLDIKTQQLDLNNSN